jgi:hypothetical protein
MTERTSTVQLNEANFYDILPSTSKAKLYAAIFFIFATFGVLWDIGTSIQRPWHLLIGWILFSGAVAVGYAWAFTTGLRRLFIVVPLSVVIPFSLEHASRALGLSTADPTGGQLIHMIVGVVMFVTGYIFFVSFINGEGARNLRLQTEVALAERIHNSLVPPVALRTSTIELRGLSSSSSEVGGDLLDAAVDGQRVCVSVADVSGHGVQAGLMMGMIKSAVRMKLPYGDDVRDLIADLNRVTLEVKAPDVFVTAAFMRFDESHQAQVALAGHPPILHYRKSDGGVHQIASEHPPLGILDGLEYTSSTIDFESGDVFLILTDGLTEVFNAAGEEFGDEPIETLLQQNAGKPLEEIEAAILDAVRAFGPQDDDQTLLLARAL